MGFLTPALTNNTAQSTQPMTAQQVLAQIIAKTRAQDGQPPLAGQDFTQAGLQSYDPNKGVPGTPGGMMGNMVGNIFNQGAGSVTGLPWLSQNQGVGSSLSALANMFRS